MPPTIRIEAHDGWWVRDAKINYNLHVGIRGPVYSMWGGASDEKFGTFGWTRDVLPGEPTVDVEIRDPEGKGFPQWELRQLLPDFGNWGYYRTNYAERRCSSPLTIVPGLPTEWPFVSPAQVGFEQPVGQLLPPIGVDWNAGRITHFSELVSVRNQNCSYSFYSINPLQKGVINDLNFETPFAFYDLSGRGNGLPNLILRTERYPANDPFSTGLDRDVQQGEILRRDLQTIRYSWHNDVGDQTWDYKVEVYGTYPYTSTTAVAGGSYTINAPSYEEFPSWVVQRPWSLVTFVAGEGGYYKYSEGIYDWSPRELGLGYLIGWYDDRNNKAFTYINEGLRGEYRSDESQHLGLYLSPIDRRVHLLGAEAGVWNLGLYRELRLQNLDGDNYLDGWTRVYTPPVLAEDDAAEAEPVAQVEEALFFLDGYVIYSGMYGAELRRLDLPPSTYEGVPPYDHASWQTGREKLSPAFGAERNPWNLHSWATALGGTRVLRTTGTISDVRKIDGGFRFALELKPGFTTSITPEAASLPPGRYIVRYDGAFSIEPSAPPALRVAPLAKGAEQRASPVSLVPDVFDIALYNNGREDSQDVMVELRLTGPDGKPVEIEPQEVAALAGEATTVRFPWVPTAPGRWTYEVVADNGVEPALASGDIVVSPRASEDVAEMVGAFGNIPPLFVLGMLAICAVSAGMLGLLLRPGKSE